ncbi:MAG TPA: glycogen/starch/alpha-glucan phosphorylase [Vicinamibacteria bacterium]|nr:glycogen/starch/alpha-glucan phosphorylase [Vicinamibacteria bacterium]
MSHAQLTPLKQGMDAESLKAGILGHLEFTLGELPKHVDSEWEPYVSVALAVRDRLMERWIRTHDAYYEHDAKRVYYLSLEFLMGRTLGNSLINLGLVEECHKAAHDLGYDLEALREAEWDAGLGNGGLGRLAACFLDSLATLELPSYGYGIRYDYGIFHQRIVDGAQVETPDGWLRYGNPWEIARTGDQFTVQFYGRVQQHVNAQGRLTTAWVDTEDVVAIPYDTPVPGYRNATVNTLRLWSARATEEFDLRYFNEGDYQRAVEEKAQSENITKVLYPNDNLSGGRELRLKQEYFFVSATLQDVIRRYKKQYRMYDQPRGLGVFDRFADRSAIQLNDTHPALAIPELMRILIDIEEVDWDEAWRVTTATFGYTNHTVMPEALERWTVDLMGRVLPRHLQIIFEINHRFLEMVRARGGDDERCRRLSIIEEDGERRVRMANLAIVGSHSVNGVAALHSEILKTDLFRDFFFLWPERFSNKTNGVTPRRWLKKANPGLSALISEAIGDGWVKDLDELRGLLAHTEDAGFVERWQAVKRANKEALAAVISQQYSHRGSPLTVDPGSMFDCQVKRIHEYKRQLLNLLHAVTRYNRIRDDPGGNHVPRTLIFGGKAAPGYPMAKLIIRLANAVGKVVNHDPVVGDRLKVVFLADYRVSLAERIFPAAELSEQISTAGTEASGTGNMKFALNGALTIGTMDGANIEIAEEVGADDVFIFGLRAAEVEALRGRYDPWVHYHANPELRRALDMIAAGRFSREQPDLFRPIVTSLLEGGDRYLLLADYAAYVECQGQVDDAYRDAGAWTRKSIRNVAHMGKFSTDRTIRQYADEIWGLKPVRVEG